MALTIYGNSQKYGAGNKYGRIEPAIATAQATFQRQTGLRITVTDSFVNGWTSLGGTINKVDSTVKGLLKSLIPDQTQEIWKQQMAMCVLTNGTIVRVFLDSDGQVWKQETTAPDSEDWDDWTLVYFISSLITFNLNVQFFKILKKQI